MTWEEIQKATLDKVFSRTNYGTEVSLDSPEVADYVKAMPHNATFAFIDLAEVMPIYKSVEVELEESVQGNRVFQVRELAPDFMRLCPDRLTMTDEYNNFYRINDYQFDGDDTLYTSIISYMIAMAGNVTNIYDPVVFSVLTDFMTGVYPLYDTKIATLGASKLPISIDVYAINYGVKQAVIDAADANGIQYTDMAGMITGMLSNMVNVISVVLVCFTSVSLVVSSVMIGIITYISVVERTKEIGILRSLGARKTDVARVFIAESLMIGLASGILGALLAYLISVPLNAVVGAVLGDMLAGATLCILQPLHALLMVGVSALLTVLAGSIPSYIASKRDPVVALRSE